MKKLEAITAAIHEAYGGAEHNRATFTRTALNLYTQCEVGAFEAHVVARTLSQSTEMMKRAVRNAITAGHTAHMMPREATFRRVIAHLGNYAHDVAKIAEAVATCEALFESAYASGFDKQHTEALLLGHPAVIREAVQLAVDAATERPPAPRSLAPTYAAPAPLADTRCDWVRVPSGDEAVRQRAREHYDRLPAVVQPACGREDTARAVSDAVAGVLFDGDSFRAEDYSFATASAIEAELARNEYHITEGLAHVVDVRRPYYGAA